MIRWLTAKRLPNGDRYRWRLRDKSFEQLTAEYPPRPICTCGKLPIGSTQLCPQCRTYRGLDWLFSGLLAFVAITTIWLRLCHPGQLTESLHRLSDVLS